MKILHHFFLTSLMLLSAPSPSLSQIKVETSVKPIIGKINIVQQKESLVDKTITIFITIVFLFGLIYSLLTFIKIINLRYEIKNSSDFFNLTLQIRPIRLVFGTLISSGLISFLINFFKLLSGSSRLNSPFYLLLISNDNNLFKVLKYSSFCGLVLIFVYFFLEYQLERKYISQNNK